MLCIQKVDFIILNEVDLQFILTRNTMQLTVFTSIHCNVLVREWSQNRMFVSRICFLFVFIVQIKVQTSMTRVWEWKMSCSNCSREYKTKSKVSEAATQSVPRKRCSENRQQIYRRTPMLKCNFNKVAKQLYWNRTSAWVFSCKFAA